MTSPVSQGLDRLLRTIFVASTVALLGATPASAGAASGGASPSPVMSTSSAIPFPDLVLKTHEGRAVRFYEDLLKGKIVLINFMYATCKER